MRGEFKGRERTGLLQFRLGPVVGDWGLAEGPDFKEFIARLNSAVASASSLRRQNSAFPFFLSFLPYFPLSFLFFKSAFQQKHRHRRAPICLFLKLFFVPALEPVERSFERAAAVEDGTGSIKVFCPSFLALVPLLILIGSLGGSASAIDEAAGPPDLSFVS
jgi:hypothetical protein